MTRGPQASSCDQGGPGPPGAAEHCPDPGCLMGFAGSVEKADARGSHFCPVCAQRLPPWLRRALY